MRHQLHYITLLDDVRANASQLRDSGFDVYLVI